METLIPLLNNLLNFAVWLPYSIKNKQTNENSILLSETAALRLKSFECIEEQLFHRFMKTSEYLFELSIVLIKNRQFA